MNSGKASALGSNKSRSTRIVFVARLGVAKTLLLPDVAAAAEPEIVALLATVVRMARFGSDMVYERSDALKGGGTRGGHCLPGRPLPDQCVELVFGPVSEATRANSERTVDPKRGRIDTE